MENEEVGDISYGAFSTYIWNSVEPNISVFQWTNIFFPINRGVLLHAMFFNKEIDDMEPIQINLT